MPCCQLPTRSVTWQEEADKIASPNVPCDESATVESIPFIFISSRRCRSEEANSLCENSAARVCPGMPEVCTCAAVLQLPLVAEDVR